MANRKTNATEKARLKAATAAAEKVREWLSIETLETRNSDRLDFHEIPVSAIRDAIEIAFEAGYAAGRGTPAPYRFDPKDPGAMLDTLEITKRVGRPTGGTWVRGTIGGHAFEALVFPEHATDAAYELDGSRISKLHIKDGDGDEVACFDRGWDRQPTTDAAKAIVGLLAAGLAEHIFGK